MNVSKPWCIELGFNLLWGNNISQQNTKQGFIISLNILNLQIDQENMIFHLVAINYYSKKKKQHVHSINHFILSTLEIDN